MSKIYLFLFRTSEGHIFAFDQGVQAEKDLEKAKSRMPNYNGYHAADTTWSASATMYWLNFRPCVVEINEDFNLEEWCELKTITVNNFSGSQRGVVIKKEKYKEVENSIVYDPKLITDEIKTARPFYEEV